MIVAIDGPAGSGKSTVAHAVSERLGFTFLDTGAMYRAVTLLALEEKVELTDEEALTRLAQNIVIEFETAPDGEQHVLVGGRDVTSDIRTSEVDRGVSPVSAVAGVREAMVERQRDLARGANVVAEGRDIGTKVFPEAEVKIFLTADPERRAHRRALQRNIHDEAAESEILADLKRRDEADSTRAVSPLVAAPDAQLMDSTDLTIDEEVAIIKELVDKAAGKDEGEKATTDEAGVADGAQAAPVTEAVPEPVSEPVPEPVAEPAAKEPIWRRLRWGKAKEGKATKAKGESEGRSPFRRMTADEYHETPMREFPLPTRALVGVAAFVCGVFSKVFWPWTIEDGHYLWDAPKGSVVVMNHVSMLDPVLAVVTDYFHGRRIRPIYRSEFDDNAIGGWFLTRMGGIPVQRGSADIKAVRRAQRALERGEDVLVYPEGTRVRSDDQEVELHAGFALMAQLAKAPVIPLAISGARDGCPGGNGPLRPHRIHLAAGTPITFDDLGVKGRKQQAKAMEERAMGEVYRLRDALFARFPKWR